MAEVQESQLLQALEYFNLPESLWPLGLYIRRIQELKCDKVATQMMTKIKADFLQLAKQDSQSWCTRNFIKRYSVNDSEDGLYLGTGPSFGSSVRLSQISELLKDCLRDLAAIEFLSLEFIQAGHTGLSKINAMIVVSFRSHLG
ncbi:hypothetical protein WJX77_007987 [Trebouxia sp. C0004]